jgi:hypothetical protein
MRGTGERIHQRRTIHLRESQVRDAEGFLYLVPQGGGGGSLLRPNVAAARPFHDQSRQFDGEGRPSQAQVERTDAIGHELADVVSEFDGWAARELGGLNAGLAAKHLESIPQLTPAQWEARAGAGED